MTLELIVNQNNEIVEEPKKNILIYGSTGYLGLFYIRRLLENKKFNFKVDFTNLLTKRYFDLSSVDAVLYFAVIHQADTEKHSVMFDINTKIPIALAQKCSRQNIHFLYMSTEQVFASKEGFIYQENSKQNSTTLYGNSKSIAEKNIANLSTSTILRTSMIYGYNHPRKKNLFNYIDMASIEPKKIYEDAYTKPTLVDELCDCIDYLLEKQIYGIYHAVGPEMIDRVTLLRKYFTAKGYSKSTLDYMIVPAKTPENGNIQKYIDIRTSEILKPFFKSNIDYGILKQAKRELKVGK